MATETARAARILIVEDEGIVASDIEKCLEYSGYEVTGVASSAEDAIAEASQTRPDLVLMDIRIRGKLDGVATADLLYRQFGVSVIYLTAHGDRETIERAKATKPLAFLLKPFEESDLNNAVMIGLNRLEADRELRERERSLMAAMDFVGDAVFSTDGRGQVRFINRAAETLTGWKQRDAFGRPLTDLFEAEELLPDADTETEHRIRTRDGVSRWVSARTRTIDSTDGLPIRVVVVQDISRRKAIEQALRESELQGRQVADSIPQLAWVTKPNGEHIWHNKRWYEYTGATEETSAGEGWRQFFHEDDQPLAWQIWRHSLATGEPYQIEHRCRRYDGVYRWFLGRALPICDQQGQIVRWFGTCTDIHDQKVAQDGLRRSNEDLRQFIWAASHDLNEPLRMVSTFTELLSRRYSGVLDQQGREFLDYAATGARRVAALLQGLQDYWRLSERGEECFVATKLEDVVGEALRNLETTIAETGAAISCDCLPTVTAERTPLVQVFQNLIGNALKYRHPARPPHVRVSASLQDHECVVTVRDNGIGIAPQYTKHVFGIFKRLHRDEYPGTGIGLALCQRIIERHGGRIWVESVPGEGSHFSFALPVLPGGAQVETARAFQ